jgi:FO synthase subunit 1
MHRVSEILLMSGEGLESLPGPKRQLAERNYPSLVEFAADVARRALKRGLLPHTNIGVLTEEELEHLKPLNASMGLMLENANEGFGRKVHPGKSISRRLETIAAAGRLQIPFTTGILVGLGETQGDRLKSLETLATIHDAYGHLQELIIQNYVPNTRSTIARHRLRLGEYEELISVSQRLMPDVPVQVPPNLNAHWLDCVRFGARDLGGVSTQPDSVNSARPWQPSAWYGRVLEEAGYRLVRRLPVYQRFIERGWVSPAVSEVIFHVQRSVAS